MGDVETVAKTQMFASAWNLTSVVQAVGCCASLSLSLSLTRTQIVVCLFTVQSAGLLTETVTCSLLFATWRGFTKCRKCGNLDNETLRIVTAMSPHT